MKTSTTLVAYCHQASVIYGRTFNFRYYQKLTAGTKLPENTYHLYGDGGELPPKGRGPQPWFHALTIVKPSEKFVILDGKKIVEQGYYVVPRGTTQEAHVYKYLDRLYIIICQKGAVWFSTQATVYDFRYRKAMKVEDKAESILHEQLVSTEYGWWLSDALCMQVADAKIGTKDAYNYPPIKGGGLHDLKKSFFQSDFRRFVFHNGEWEIFQFAMETYRLTGVMSVPGRLSAGLGRAYVSAVEDIPQLSCNSIANALEAIGLIKTFANIFKSGGLIKMIAENLKSAKKPAQLWLKYRYQYCTTKMDVTEIIDFSGRIDEIANCIQDISCKGTYTDKDNTLYKCSIRYSPAQIVGAMPDSRKYGFELNAVNAWDMIPYSFVVDWFAHIGDTLQVLQSYKNSFDYKPIEVWYSVRTTYKDEVVFMRLPGSGNCPTPTTVSRSASGKTLFMRVADTLSLFF